VQYLLTSSVYSLVQNPDMTGCRPEFYLCISVAPVAVSLLFSVHLTFSEQTELVLVVPLSCISGAYF